MTPEIPKPIILVVDDAPDTLGMVSRILEEAGLTALVAADGKSALALLSHVVPDLILMDAVMPRQDGFETCRAIKQLESFAHTPVIFMTGLSDTENVVKGFDAGGVDYIAKPIVPAEIVARVRVHLANSRLTQSARLALDVAGPPLIAADAAGGILWVTPQGLALLEEAQKAPDWRGMIAPGLKRVLEARTGDTLLLETDGKTIFAAFIGEARPGEYLVRLKDGGAPREEEILQSHFALTGR
jgi:CheY-like chemotaxis protein